jgi:hypothetical protein
MPTAETLERFISRVEENAHAEAIEEFYTVGAQMQENQSEPRVGRDAHVANERREMPSRWTDASEFLTALIEDLSEIARTGGSVNEGPAASVVTPPSCPGASNSRSRMIF